MLSPLPLHYQIVELFFYFFEIVFTYPTQRAYPIFGNVFECSSRSDTTFRITDFRIIYPIAYSTNILLHNQFCFNDSIIW